MIPKLPASHTVWMIGVLACTSVSLPAAEAALSLERPPAASPRAVAVSSLLLDLLREVVAFRQHHGLDAGQEAAVSAIFARHRDAVVLQAHARLESHRALRNATQAGSPDEARVRAAADHLGAVVGQGALLRSRIAQEIAPHLHPAQRTAWRALVEKIDSQLDAFLAERL